MATAPMSVGQMKELASACVEAIPADLSSELAQKWIGKKKELGVRLREILLEGGLSGLPGINPAKMYEALGLTAEYEAFALANAIPNAPNLWTLPVLQGLTCNKLVAAMKTLGVKFYLYADDLDKAVPTNDRDPNRDGSYIVSFARNIEADEENKNLSANQLKERNHKGITLLERLLLELGYFLATGKHLDESNWTLCSGSRGSDGSVPHVYWYSDDRKVYVRWYYPAYCYGHLRSRSAVSLP